MRSSAILLALGLSGCGPGLHDLGHEAGPLLTLHGRIDRSALPAESQGKPLVAALVWGGVTHFDLLCLKYAAEPEVQAACPNPFAFSPGEIAADAVVADDGTFTLPLQRLPSADVSVGDPKGRVAYGSVLVAVDTNADGAFELQLFRGSEAQEPDHILAASFARLDEHQQRVVFREGAFDEKSFFYPVTGCPTPPIAFSILSGIVQLDPQQPPAEPCRILPVSEPILPVPLSEEVRHGLECDSISRLYESRTFEGDRPYSTEDATLTRCLDDGTLLVPRADDACETVVLYSLVGCADLACKEPVWDDRAHPPSWWPCPVEAP